MLEDQKSNSLMEDDARKELALVHTRLLEDVQKMERKLAMILIDAMQHDTNQDHEHYTGTMNQEEDKEDWSELADWSTTSLSITARTAILVKGVERLQVTSKEYITTIIQWEQANKGQRPQDPDTPSPVGSALRTKNHQQFNSMVCNLVSQVNKVINCLEVIDTVAKTGKATHSDLEVDPENTGDGKEEDEDVHLWWLLPN